jgi:large subunit ribosomal protein L10
MNRDQKAVAIAEIAEHIKASDAIFAVDYRGITVAQVAELRTKLRDADATFKVVKNSLTERAADEVGATELKGFLAGPTALTFVRGDVAMAAKAIADYARATQLLPFKGGMMGGEEIAIDQIRALSKLPSREVLYAQLVGVVASPIGGLVRSLGGMLGGLAVALGQVREKKESGEIPAGEPPAAQAPASAPAAEEQAQADADAPEPEAPQDEAPAAAEAATETDATPEAEAPAEPEAGGDEKTEPSSEEPAQEDDKQADVSADAESQDAETNPTKED